MMTIKAKNSYKYEESDILKYKDGWWITFYSESQSKIIKIMGAYKTKAEAIAEMKILNSWRNSINSWRDKKERGKG